MVDVVDDTLGGEGVDDKVPWKVAVLNAIIVVDDGDDDDSLGAWISGCYGGYKWLVRFQQNLSSTSNCAACNYTQWSTLNYIPPNFIRTSWGPAQINQSHSWR